MTHDAATTLAGLLKQHRAARGLTQEALAERAGISVRALKGIEQSAAHQPRADTLTRLASALRLHRDEEAALYDAARVTKLSRISRPATHMMIPLSESSSLTALIGRDDFIRDALSLLRDENTRLLTLIGPPGVGKTRLGTEIAHRSAASEGGCASRVVCIALAPLSDPALILPTMAHALGVQEARSPRPLEDLVAALATTLCGSGKTMLFLDNFEHLLAAANELVSVLTRCADLTIMVTSRAALRVRGEHELPVPPLEIPALPQLDQVDVDTCERPSTLFHVSAASTFGSLPSAIQVAHMRTASAVALFVQRARAIQPTFDLNAHNARAIAAICAQLDGLPLAIELAAARIRVLNPSALLERLAHRLPLLVEHSQDLPPRQRTMRDAIAWSYDLLTEHEQSVFRQMGVFAGGCTLEAAESVCARLTPGTAVIDDVTTLVAHSLVQRSEGAHGGTCFTMLQTIREFALEQLEATGERAMAEQSHAEYFCTLVESMAVRLRERHDESALSQFREIYPNIQLALGWAIEHSDTMLGPRLIANLWRYWYSQGMLTEGRGWISALLNLMGDADLDWIDGSQDVPNLPAAINASIAEHSSEIIDPSVRAHYLAGLLSGAGMLAFRQGDYVNARAWLERSLALHRWRDDQRAIAAALNNLGIVAADQGCYAEAQTLHEASLAIKRELNLPQDIAASLNNLGSVARAQGRYTQATAYLEENLTILRKHGNSYRIAHALGNLGTLAYMHGQYERARILYHECLILQFEVSDTQGIALTTLNLGEVANACGELAQAQAHAQESLAIFRTLNEPARIVSALALLALITSKQGDVEAATVYLRESLDLCDQLGSHRAAHLLAVALARWCEAQGMYVSALQFLAAGESQRDAKGITWAAAERTEYLDCVERSRTQLEVRAFCDLWNVASAWSWSDLLVHARGSLLIASSLGGAEMHS